jgi:transcriptional regulator with XRE-family HTH domain
VPIDWRQVAELVRKDRGDTSQGRYGHEVGGLSQGQISDLERARVSRPTAAMLDALRRRFGELPERRDETSSREPERDSEHSLLTLSRTEMQDREFMEAFWNLRRVFVRRSREGKDAWLAIVQNLRVFAKPFGAHPDEPPKVESMKRKRKV